jgi:hypothetical protein
MSLHHMLRAAAGSAPSDPYFENVTLLLSGDGTNGAQNNTFLDSSSNNFTITRNGNTTQGSFSPYGNLWSNYFDGSGDYLLAGGTVNIGSGDYTIEAWVYLNALPTYSMICGYGSQSYIGVRPTSLAFGNSTGATYPEWDFTFSTGTWYHVAVVKQSNTLKAFVNGNQLALSSGSASSSAIFCAGQLYVGRYGGSPTYDLNGYISNFRTVNGTAVYTTTFTPPTAPLTAVSGTSLLTCQSNRFIDNSSNNFAITVNGNTSVQRFSPFNPTAPYSTSVIGGSGYFDGTGDYLTAPNSTAFDFSTSTFTVEAWVFVPSVSVYQMIVEYTSSDATDADYNWYVFISSTGKATVSTRASGSSSQTNVVSTPSLIVNAWNHIAVTRVGTTGIVYVNGVGTTGTLPATIRNNAGSTLKIGADAGPQFGVSGPFNGYMNSLRIVKGTAVYTGNFALPTLAPLTTEGSTSAACYPSTTNINTTFASSDTSLLASFTNAGIPDAAMMNDLETVGNAQVSTSVKKYGTGSLYFDGTGDYLKIPKTDVYNLGNGDFTIEGWINFNVNQDSTVIARINNSGTGDWSFFYNSTVDKWRIVGSGQTIQMSNTWVPTIGQWYYIAVCRSGNNFYFFVDGVQQGTTQTNTVTFTFTDANPTFVGALNDGTLPLNGYIDDLRITKGLARYTANFTPPTAALPVY